MTWTFLSLFTNIFTPLLTLAGAAITIIGLFFGVKQSGKREARAEAEANTMKGAYEAESERRAVDTNVYRLNDVDLARLQSKWTVDELELPSSGEAG